METDGTVAVQIMKQLQCGESEVARDLCIINHTNADRMIRSVVASHPSCPEYVMERLSTDDSIQVRISLMFNPNVTLDIVKHIAKMESHRHTIACSPNCPVSVLEEWAMDKDDELVCAVVRNSSCPVSVLQKLVHHECNDVRLAIYMNENCPPETRIYLENLESTYVVITQ